MYVLGQFLGNRCYDQFLLLVHVVICNRCPTIIAIATLIYEIVYLIIGEIIITITYIFTKDKLYYSSHDYHMVLT